MKLYAKPTENTILLIIFSFQLINTPIKKRIIKARFYQRILFCKKEDSLCKLGEPDLAILFSYNTFVFR